MSLNSTKFPCTCFSKFLVIFFFTIVFAQTQRWIYTYPYDNGCAKSIVYDLNSGLCVAGYSNGDFTVISLTVDGDTNWIYTYNDSVQQTGQANSIALGSNGNIYAVGSSGEPGMLYQDITAISLTNEGNMRWIYHHNGSGNEWDEGRSITVGVNENIYVAGVTTDSSTYHDFTVISLDSLENERWIYSYVSSHGVNGNCEAYDIVSGIDGNLYTAGIIAGDFAMISFDTSGNENWVYQKSGGSPGTWDIAYSIVYGNDDNIYAAGYLHDPSTGENFTIISTTDSGEERWVYTYNGSESAGFDKALSVVYGEDDNIYAVGFTHDSTTNMDFTVISLDTAGVERWVYTCNGTDNYRGEEGISITYGLDGNIYAAGYTADTATYAEFTVVGLDTSGSELWLYKYDGSAHEYDEAFSIIYGNDSSLYIGGYSKDSVTWYNFTVISLDPNTCIEENYLSKAHIPRIEVFPNPFNDKISIKVSLKNINICNAEIYDVTGKIVKHLKQNVDYERIIWDGRNEAGDLLPSGVYFFNFKVDEHQETKKLLLIR